MNINIEAFWRRVKSLAKEKYATQEEIAKAIGMPPRTFRGWVSNEIIPSLDYVVELSRFFGVTISYLVYGKDTDPVMSHGYRIME